MIEASAPGKVVLWGEYAVLAGAPAVVMAVDRYARCRIEPGTDSGAGAWRVRALGYDAAATDLQIPPAAQAPAADSAAYLAWHALRAGGTTDLLPGNASLTLDTRAFFQDGAKLGIGSSAALTVALHGALSRLQDRQPNLETALAIHHEAQGRRGSGLDVAAAWYGGVIRFEAGTAAPLSLPEDLCCRFFWTGQSASTPDHLQRFAAYRQRPRTPALRRLFEAALQCTDDPGFSALVIYARALADLDREAGLGIYAGGHADLTALAPWGEVVYKPCGAGGGDLGALFFERRHTEAADRFTEQAAASGAKPIALDTAPHGLRTRR